MTLGLPAPLRGSCERLGEPPLIFRTSPRRLSHACLGAEEEEERESGDERLPLHFMRLINCDPPKKIRLIRAAFVYGSERYFDEGG